MRRQSAIIVSLFGLVFGGCVASCSSSDSTPGGGGGGAGGGTATCPTLDVSKISGSATRAEVDVVLARSCAFSGCHSKAGTPGGGLVLEGADWPTKVVDKPSTQNTTMSLVKKGDPTNSWLIHKTHATQCNFKASCVSGNCKSSMPEGTGPLDAEGNAVLVKWVLGGAP